MGLDIGPGMKISTSLLSADLGRLAEEIRKVEEAGADLHHLDVMDGHFAPKITIGPPLVAAAKPHAQIPLDVHLMIEKPERHIEEFVSAGADIITVHVETCTHLHRTIQQIKSLDIKAGVALNPSTPLESVQHVYGDVDLVVILAVNPGFGGQKFIPTMLSKVRALKEQKPDDTDIMVDGGISPDNASTIIEAGANLLVSGSAVFKTSDYRKAIAALRGQDQ